MTDSDPIDWSTFDWSTVDWSTRFRTRYLCFSFNDWKAFGDALVERYPDALYYPWWLEGRFKEEPPVVPFAKHICDLVRPDSNLPPRVIMAPDPSLIPELKKSSFGDWDIGPPPRPNIRIETGLRIMDRDGMPPFIQQGDITVSCRKDFPEDFNFARRLINLSAKFSTCKHQLWFNYPDLVAAKKVDKSTTWLGYDAIRWVLEDENRILGVHSGRGMIRPDGEAIAKSRLAKILMPQGTHPK